MFYHKINIISFVKLWYWTNEIKSTWILFQFLFLMEKSIRYAKITVSQNFFFQNSVLIII